MAQHAPSHLSVGMMLFPSLTLLDLAGPYDVFSRMPGAHVYLVASSLEPIRTEKGLTLTPDTSFENAPLFDILFVPGGPGQQLVMEDEGFLNFLRERGQTARLLTSVCTGSLILGAAGLLQGYRATTHWRYLDLLSLLGAQPVAERVIVDRNRITGAGVSAGIDLALSIVSVLFGKDVAQSIQLSIEYDPQPPFPGGSPNSADPELVAGLSAKLDDVYTKRRRQIERIVARL
ncbi:DJ-1/PfpI family protein [Ktedonobacter racemifer]|uniref:ThiJ/PfpI domain protein n=1 Tax=Ktedonobacter racemifer DSM 44963 TaxID=485913 RepID=D6TKM2_KTERA|nr:DJ-1/PfpI family protein [Ktedonobacter racemifer]EFH86322.1 ThiJ/PfpI domain protein [Ktedonobacter racemifer DSM 44963]